MTHNSLTHLTHKTYVLLTSRPLNYQSADPKDDIPLTPNHFLFGQVGGQFAPETVDETKFNPKKRWRRFGSGYLFSASEESG